MYIIRRYVYHHRVKRGKMMFGSTSAFRNVVLNPPFPDDARLYGLMQPFWSSRSNQSSNLTFSGSRLEA
jgi:hypothetical protein